MDSKEFIHELREGSREAFEILFNRYSPMIFSVLLRVLRNRQDAEEVSQEVFFQAYKSLKSFRADAQISTWLYRIAVNRALNHQRKKKLERWFSLDFDSRSQGAQNSEYPDLTTEGPADLMKRCETEAIVRTAIDELPQKQRIAVLLNRYDGLSYEEIAKVMGVSVASVESRLHRAKQSLAVKLLALKG